jgi:GNAT superfamily N-acetyltransferase
VINLENERVISLRLATTKEIDAIIDLQTLSLLNSHVNSRKYNCHQIDSLVKGQADARRQDMLFETIVVAENSDQSLVGFAAIANHGPVIQGIFVHPSFMRQGIGTQLLKEIRHC